MFLVLNSQSNDVEEHKEAIELAIAANPDAAIESYYYISRSTAVRIMRWMEADVLAVLDGLVPAFDELDIDAD